MPNHATAIEWMTALADAKDMRADVWNWAEGCTAAGEGCRNCWAAAEVYIRGHQSGKTGERFGGLAEMRGGRPVFNGAVRVIESDMTKPLRTKRPTVYFCSRFDPFHEDISDADRDLAFAVMALCPQHLFVILTKRPEVMREYFSDDAARRKGIRTAYSGLGAGNCWMPEWPLPNLWLGTSIWDQPSADAFIPPLLDTPAALHFVSAEPLLGPVDLRPWMHGLGWVFGGGESGKHARPTHPDCFRSLRDQCQAAGVPFLFKQWGEWGPVSSEDLPERFGPECDAFRTMCSNGFVGGLNLESAFLHKPSRWPQCFPHGEDGDASCSGAYMRRVGKKAAGRLLDGREHLEVPA